MSENFKELEKRFGKYDWKIVEVNKNELAEVYKFKELNHENSIFYSFTYGKLPKLGVNVLRGDIGKIMFANDWDITYADELGEMIKRASPDFVKITKDLGDFDIKWLAYAVMVAEKRIKELEVK